jgi:mycoredoxin
MTENNEILFYSTKWCPDCHRAQQILDQRGTAYQYIDISKDAKARAYVEKVNNGNRSVPTIVFPDGDILVEPSNAVLNKKLDSLE